MEQTGTRGVNGEWIPETPQAKLRNKLTPFWVLTDVLSTKSVDEVLESDDIKGLINDLVDQCEKNKSTILNLIKETEQ